MLRLIYLLLPLLIFISRAEAINLGVAQFGLLSKKHQGRKCTKMLQVFNRSKLIFSSALIGDFGNERGCLRRLIKKKTERVIVQLHAENSAGRRNGQLIRGALLPSFNVKEWARAWREYDLRVVRAYQQRILPWTRFALRHPHVTWILSEGLETNDSHLETRHRVFAARAVWPFLVSVNPLKFNYRYISIGDLFELHTDKPRQKLSKRQNCIINNDGTYIRFAGDVLGPEREFADYREAGEFVRDAKSVCSYTLLWDGPSSNGRQAGAPWSSPRQRNFSRTMGTDKRMNKLLIKENGRL